MGSYSQQWINKRITSGDQLKAHKSAPGTQWACYGGMQWKKEGSHTFFQWVSKKCADKHEELLTWMQQYFKFDFGRHVDVKEYINRIRGDAAAAIDGGVGFWISFDNADFQSKPHRLLFLTLARGCHEHPSLYMKWDVATGWEGIWKQASEWTKNNDYEFQFVVEPNDGHGLLNGYDKTSKVVPSMETMLVACYTGHDGSMQHLTGKLMKAKK